MHNKSNMLFPAHMDNSIRDKDIAHDQNAAEHKLAKPLRFSVGRCVVAGKRANKRLVIFENSPDFLAVRGGMNGYEIIAEYDVSDTGDAERNRAEVKRRFYRDFNPKKFGFVS